MLTFAESKHPIFRSTSPLSRGVLKSKGGVKLSIHFCADGVVNPQCSRSSLREECNICHVRTGRPVVTILHKKKIYCKDTRNELKSCHNKTE